MPAVLASPERSLALVLRGGAVLMLLAFPAALWPDSWMAAAHRALGLGEFPRDPLTGYLARSASLLYGFHGVLLWLVARDPRRFRPVVAYCGWMALASGMAMLGIDLHVGMPRWWTAIEGPGVLLCGALVLGLLRRLPAGDAAGARPVGTQLEGTGAPELERALRR